MGVGTFKFSIKDISICFSFFEERRETLRSKEDAEKFGFLPLGLPLPHSLN